MDMNDTMRYHNMQFGKRIKHYRELIGMNQDELAKKLGYSASSSIAKIETGVARVPLSKVKKFAEALGVPEEELMQTGVKTFAISTDSTIKLQHIMLILAQMNDEQITKAESILSTIFENN